MKIAQTLAVAALAAAPVLGIAAPAVAHDGTHPFKNCTAAAAAGHSNIPAGDKHYGTHLDRDGDGYGCDKHGTLANDGRAGTGSYAKAGEKETTVEADAPEDGKGPDLAETGGHAATPYIAGAAAVLLGGGAALALRRKRQN